MRKGLDTEPISVQTLADLSFKARQRHGYSDESSGHDGDGQIVFSLRIISMQPLAPNSHVTQNTRLFSYTFRLYLSLQISLTHQTLIKT